MPAGRCCWPVLLAGAAGRCCWPVLLAGAAGRCCWPIRDPAHVNERRKKAGFEQTVEANAQRLGIEYRPLTLNDVKKLPGYQVPKH
jgi:hypothetical protein